MIEWWEGDAGWLPAALIFLVSITALFIANWLLLGRRQETIDRESVLPRQLTMLFLSVLAMITVVLSLPVENSTRNQLLTLLGIALTAVVSFSSTTFVSNAMAGLMLRFVGSFKPGDFIRIADHLGRVTERGLLHTEIQTEDRDLITLPNLFVVSNPVRTVRKSGTIVSAELSLGYEVSHATLEPLLGAAARATGLADPFVQVKSLGDFSVVYRVAGFLENPKQLLTTGSNLRRNILRTLHKAGIEIVSPTFMNQRQLDPNASILPDVSIEQAMSSQSVRASEDMVFDKADAVEQLANLREARDQLQGEIQRLEGEEGQDESSSVERVRRIARHRAALAAVAESIGQYEKLEGEE